MTGWPNKDSTATEFSVGEHRFRRWGEGFVEYADPERGVWTGVVPAKLLASALEKGEMKSKAAAKFLLDMFREGAFENDGDAMAQDAADAGGDVQAIIENWLRGVAVEVEE